MTLRQRYNEALAQIALLNAKIDSLQELVFKLQTTIDTDGGVIADLRTQITDLQAQLAAAHTRIAELEAQLPAPTPTPTPPPPSTAGVMLGAWCEFGGDGNSSTAEQDQFDTLSQAKMVWTMMYAPFSVNGGAYGFAPSTAIYNRGANPHWAWGNPPAGTNLATFIPDIAAGKYDAMIRQTCQNMAAISQGRPFQWRPFWEMNGRWQEWNAEKYGNNTTPFKDAWRRIATICRNNAPQVQIVWAPNATSLPKETWNTLAAYYPGDDYVDLVAASIYNAAQVDNLPWRSFATLVTEFETVAPNKPHMMSEGACVEDPATPGRKGQWIKDMAAYVKANPQWAELLWFHRPPVTQDGPKDYRVDTSPGSLAAWRALCADPYFKRQA